MIRTIRGSQMRAENSEKRQRRGEEREIEKES